jgi:hypothetical protein
MNPCSRSSACSAAVVNNQWIDEQRRRSASVRTPSTSRATTGPRDMSFATSSRGPVAGVIGTATTSFG